MQGESHPALSMLNRLCLAVDHLLLEVRRRGNGIPLLKCCLKQNAELDLRTPNGELWPAEPCRLLFFSLCPDDTAALTHASIYFVVVPVIISQKEQSVECLQDIANILTNSDVSPFEILHSGLVSRLLNFLTSNSGREALNRNTRLKRFLHVFLHCPVGAYALPFELWILE